MKFMDFLVEGKPILLKSAVEIETWLTKHHIKDFVITEIDGSLTVRVNGNVKFENAHIEYLPVVFTEVTGTFIINKCGLKSLKGVPQIIDGNFNCSNNRLQSLSYGPTNVGGDYSCSYNLLTMLKSPLKQLAGGFDFSRNVKLKSMEGIIDIVNGEMDGSNCDLRSLEFSPKEVNGTYNVGENFNLTSLEHITPIIGGDVYFNLCKIESLRHIAKYLKKCKTFYVTKTVIKEMMGLVILNCETLSSDVYGDEYICNRALAIILKYRKSKKVLDCQEELIAAELEGPAGG